VHKLLIREMNNAVQILTISNATNMSITERVINVVTDIKLFKRQYR